MVFWFVSAAVAGAPTHLDIDEAHWRSITRAHADEVGEISLLRSEVDGVDCHRGEAQVGDVSIEALLSTVTNVVGAMQWSSAGIVDAEVLDRDGDYLEYYQVLDVPDWTFASDRYWFVEAEVLRHETGEVDFRWTRLHDDAQNAARARVEAAHPGAVETPVLVGGWTFAPRGEEVELSYVICSDTGGSLPRMLQNTATRRTLPTMVADLVREARRIGP